MRFVNLSLREHVKKEELSFTVDIEENQRLHANFIFWEA